MNKRNLQKFFFAVVAIAVFFQYTLTTSNALATQVEVGSGGSVVNVYLTWGGIDNPKFSQPLSKGMSNSTYVLDIYVTGQRIKTLDVADLSDEGQSKCNNGNSVKYNWLLISGVNPNDIVSIILRANTGEKLDSLFTPREFQMKIDGLSPSFLLDGAVLDRSKKGKIKNWTNLNSVCN